MGTRLKENLGKWVSLARKIIPLSCGICGSSRIDDLPVCRGCYHNLPFLREPACPVCRKVFPQPSTISWKCGTCLKNPPPFERAFIPLDYHSEISLKLMKYLKDSGTGWVVKLIAVLISDILMRENVLEEIDFIVPVPPTPSSFSKRLFNPPGEIARVISSIAGIKTLQSVLYVKKEPPFKQANLPLNERFNNLKGVFAVRKKQTGRINGRTVLLLDDVITSTATVRECSTLLLKSGAGKVYVAGAFRA